MNNPFFKAGRKARLYRRVFSSADGKAVLEDLAAEFHFVQENGEPLTPFEDGKRQAFIYILRNVNADIGALIECGKEFEKQQRENEEL